MRIQKQNHLTQSPVPLCLLLATLCPLALAATTAPHPTAPPFSGGPAGRAPARHPNPSPAPPATPAESRPGKTPLLDEAVAFIEPFEGRRHRTYADSRGHATVGVGFNLDRAGARDDLKKLLPAVRYRDLRRGQTRLTDDQIDTLLRHDTRRAIRTARRQISNFDTLPRTAQLVIVDMTFNLGGLSDWHDLRAALADRSFSRCARAMHDSRWRTQTGRRAAHLIALMQDLAG